MRTLLPGLLTILVLSVSTLNAQAGNPAGASDTTTLRQQFDDMLRVSNRYQQFRVVRQDFLNAFIVNVEDSIRVYTKEIDQLNGTIASQRTQIEGLTTDVQERDGNITALTDEKDSMSLLGMSLSKATYATVMWATILGLLALCVFAFLRMKVALASAREARENSNQLSDDLAKAKKRRLEVEQDLGRKLQDEINKNRNR